MKNYFKMSFVCQGVKTKLLNKRIIFPRFLCVLILMLVISSVGYCTDAPPLPVDINIVMPGANVPADLAKLSGKWVGTLRVQGKNYDDTAKHVLIVENIDEVGIITVIYARGDYTRLHGYPPAFWARYKAFWGDAAKELVVTYPYDNKYITITYKLTSEGKLIGTGQAGIENRQASLHRE